MGVVYWYSIGSSIYKAKGDTSVPDNNWDPPPSEEESWDDDSELLITINNYWPHPHNYVYFRR